MGDIVNLRQVRKNKARQDREAQAETNRQLHGRTKAQKQLEKQQSDKLRRHLDAHHIEKETTEDKES